MEHWYEIVIYFSHDALPNLTAAAMQQQSVSPNLFGNCAMP